MKHSIRGRINTGASNSIVELLNGYTLWRLTTGTDIDMVTSTEYFTFEVWVDNVEDKNSIFEGLKPFVGSQEESIDYHICSHDESIPTSCNIVEEYRGD